VPRSLETHPMTVPVLILAENGSVVFSRPILAHRVIGARVSSTVVRRERHSTGFSLGRSSVC
jgi:hypothetical protein